MPLTYQVTSKLLFQSVGHTVLSVKLELNGDFYWTAQVLLFVFGGCQIKFSFSQNLMYVDCRMEFHPALYCSSKEKFWKIKSQSFENM